MRFPIVIAVFSGLTLADHLPENLVARGKAETVLCGIDVYHSRLPELREKLGKPVSYEKYPKTEEAAEIVWDKDGAKIHATINADNIAYAVEVTGKASAITRTGRGLALGQTLADLQKIYGPRFQKRGNQVTLQWHDGTEMRVKLTGSRIRALTLIAQIE